MYLTIIKKMFDEVCQSLFNSYFDQFFNNAVLPGGIVVSPLDVEKDENQVWAIFKCLSDFLVESNQVYMYILLFHEYFLL